MRPVTLTAKISTLKRTHFIAVSKCTFVSLKKVFRFSFVKRCCAENYFLDVFGHLSHKHFDKDVIAE